MYERFTDRARKVMQLANQEAQRFNHEYIGTEHILLGLVKEGSGVAANVLKNLDVDIGKLSEAVLRVVQPGKEQESVVMDRLPHTPLAKKVVEYAIAEARALSHNYVGTEHLLLGVLREGEGVAARALTDLGLRLADVRRDVLTLLGPPAAPDLVLHRIDAALTPPGPDARLSDPLPAEFAALDAVIAKMTAVLQRAARAKKFVEAEWFAEQVESLSRVREAIVRRQQGP